MKKIQSGQTSPKTIIGIDYSLTSPAICVTEDFIFENSQFYYLTNKKKYIGPMSKNIFGFEHKEYKHLYIGLVKYLIGHSTQSKKLSTHHN